MTGNFESFDGTSIFYEIRGRGEPLVLIYGIACPINHWHHQIEYFSQRYQVITFDLRGHYKSNPVVDLRNLNIESLGKDIIGLMAHLGVDSAHFAGHSFGVPLLLHLFSVKPDLIKSMVFINGFAKNPIEGMFGLDVIAPFFYFIKNQYENQPDMWNTLWKLAVDNPITMYLTALAGGFNLKVTHFKDIEVYARGVARMNLEVFLTLFEELMRFDGESILSRIKVPVLVIAGEKDLVTPLRFQTHLHEKIKNSKLVIVPYGSHCTQLDFPDYSNLKIEKFLDEQN